MKKIVFALITLCTLISCSDSENNDNQIVKDTLFPLKLNNTWTYENIIYNENGVQQSNETFMFKYNNDAVRNSLTYAKLDKIPVVNNYNFAYNLRNVDENTLEGYTSSVDGESNILTIFKKVSTNGVLINQNTSTEVNRTRSFYAYSDYFNVNGYSSLKNEEIETETSTGIVMSKSIYYLKPQLGWTKIESYRKKSNSNELYLRETITLNNYTFN